MAEANNSINFMAMLNPQFAAQQQKFALQQAMAQQMMQEGSKEEPTAQLANPGGQVIQNSPWAALSRAVEKGVGAYSAQKAIGDQMAAYAGLAGKQMPDQSSNGQGGAPLLPWQMNAATGQPQGEAIGNAMMGAGGNNPTLMEMFNPNDRLGDTMYQNRMAASKAAAVASAEAPYKMVQLADGTQVPLSTLIHSTASLQQPNPQPTLPPPQGGMPSVPQMVNGQPQAPANMDEILNQQTPTQTNVMPNIIPGTTPGVPAVNPNSPEGAARAALLKAKGTAEGENIAAADKGVVGIDSRIGNTMKTLDEMASLSNAKGHGNFGEYVGVPWSRNIGSGQEAAAQTAFELKNANLFTQELGPLMQSIQGTKGSIPLINAIKEASQIPAYGAKPEELAAISNLKEQLRIYQSNMHASAAMSKGQTAPLSDVTHTYVPGKGIIPVGGQ